MTRARKRSAPRQVSPLPAGEYVAIIAKCEERSGAKGPYFHVRFRIEDGNYAGNLLKDTLSFAPRALPYTKAKLKALGFPAEGEANIEAADLQGRRAILVLDGKKLARYEPAPSPGEDTAALSEPNESLARHEVRRAVGAWYLSQDLAPLRSIFAHGSAMDGCSSLLHALAALIGEVPTLDAITAMERLEAAGHKAEAALLRELMEESALTPDRNPDPMPQGSSSETRATEDPGEEEDGPPTDAATIAESILATRHCACDGGGRIYMHSGGTYIPGARQIRKEVKGYFVVNEILEKWSSHKANEVAEYIGVDAPVLWEAPPIDRINVLNGIIDLSKFIETGHVGDVHLVEHDPSHLSMVQLPIRYDPSAKCPAWEKFTREVFPEDALDTPWQILSWLMIPFTGIQRAILLMGEGGTGKSTFLTAVKNFLGRRNVSSKSLHRLESCRFSVGGLVGKLANICADLPSRDLAGSSVFKALTGGDEITGEHKFKDEFDLLPFARLVFSANRPPRSPDATEAFFERWIVIPFDRKFRGVQGKEIPRHKLDATLAAPEELSGALNKAIKALPGLLDRGLSTPRSARRAHAAFREATDPIQVWLAGNAICHSTMIVGKQTLRSAYNAHAVARGLPVETDTAFSMAVKRWHPEVHDGQRKWQGKDSQWCWVGIGLRRDVADESQGSQGSQGFSQMEGKAGQGEGKQGEGPGTGTSKNCGKPCEPREPRDHQAGAKGGNPASGPLASPPFEEGTL
jgi:putative DNA primase/helicase